jgi:rubrerythrin
MAKEPLYPHVTKYQQIVTAKDPKKEVLGMLADSMKEEEDAEVAYERIVDRLKRFGGYPELVNLFQKISEDEHKHWLSLQRWQSHLK